MYFEAVEEIMTKLNNPKLKGSQRSYFMKELQDLDPEGSIRSFLSNNRKGKRPDISKVLDNAQ
jgi:hypothetical protein